jgi:hypothetical protein
MDHQHGNKAAAPSAQSAQSLDGEWWLNGGGEVDVGQA